MTTAIFVHGNPETAAIWRPLLSRLDRSDLDTLSPPGFGAPRPVGFGATVDDYAEWLADELAKRNEPVDLVGHDWGAGHVIRVVMRRPELVRSWVIDLAGCFAPDYVWHDMAQVWRTPGAGEDAVADLVAMPVEQRASLYESLGMTPLELAAEVAEDTDDTMGRCILALYRSATPEVMTAVGEEMTRAAVRPGLVLVPTADPYTGGEGRARWSADRAGAQITLLPDLGHWWMMQDPTAAADALESFWKDLE
jgi:pimeloyl-ACP methyl ester carboxylesterase